MKIFTREYVEPLVYMSISAAGITAGYACLSERILEMLVDYDITKQSIEDGDFAINQ